MIRYKIDVLKALKKAGYSTYKIRQDKIFTEAQLQQIRDGKLIRQNILDKICAILQCQPGDLLEYIPDADQQQE